MLVICNSKNKDCPADCEHSQPHEPMDVSVNDTCDMVTEQCYLIKTKPHCNCEEVKTELELDNIAKLLG